LNIPLTHERLLEILERMRGLRIGVVGDFTLDGYWYADMESSQLSRETPLYPRPIVRETYSLGGAANVAWNLADLGVGEVRAFSVFGEDWRGLILRGLLEDDGIRTDDLINQADRKTPFYGKVMLTAAGRPSQEDARLDFVNTVPVSSETEDAFLGKLAERFLRLDALVIADYQAQGVVTQRVAQGLLKLAQNSPEKPVVVDSRERAAEFRSLILKPNQLEAAALFFPGREPSSITIEDLAGAALQYNADSCRPAFITRGDQGCLACADGHCETLPGVCVPPPVDTVGAGDAFLAALSAGLGSQASAFEAACLANLVAAVTVQQIGVTGTASPQQVVEMYARWVTHRS
jgi:rfaE bifunctional protein kinase chain/domain